MSGAVRRNLWWFAVPAGMVLGLETVPLILWWKFRLVQEEINAPIAHVNAMVLGIAAFALAVRIASRHPLNNLAYRHWLQTTPWRPGLPLPLGPLTPSLVDGVILTSWVALAWRFAPAALIGVPLVFATAYVFSAAVFLCRVGPFTAGIALWVALSAMLRIAPDVRVAFAIALVAYVIAQWGMERSLQTFPWGLDEWKMPQPSLGWVFEKLSPRPPQPKIGSRAAIAVPIVIGCALYAIFSHGESDAQAKQATCLIIPIVTAFLALLRRATYGGAPPIPLRGRVFAVRPILPRFDIVWIGPIVMVLLACVLPVSLLRAGAPAGAAIGITSAVVLFAMINAPPTLARWQLTGQQRMSAPKLLRDDA